MARSITFNNSILLAPMAGVNDPIFRRICKQHGADLTYSEMISAVGLSQRGRKSYDLLYAQEAEKPFALQLFGKDPDVLADQAARLSHEHADDIALIDINMGCPTRKIAGKGEGVALMREPALAERIIASVVSAVDLPVTVKFRRGFEQGQETAATFAQMAEAAGASAVAVHGRWATQFYSGYADRDVIGRVKAAVGIPVIASGDVYAISDIMHYLLEQGADAVMIARGAQGNPWLFAQAKAALAAGSSVDSPQDIAQPTLATKIGVARDHLTDLVQLFPHQLPSMRRHITWYFKGIRGATELRRRVNQCVALADYLNLLDELETLATNEQLF
ncbi:MAG: tRNA dihydrouridine synthase DusB [Coriobacteriia bacterium]|nr:tRNA dihydrouridine synthase DusB [Coriobacteriia bacterium]